MPGRVVVEAYGAELVAQELEASGDNAIDVSEIWPGILRYVQDVEKQQFATDGSRGPSGPWPDNTHEWQWHKFTNHLSLEKMRATEAMFRALTSTTKDTIFQPGPDRLELGADLDQFRIWQSGHGAGDDPRPRLPIDLTEQDEILFANTIMVSVIGRLIDADKAPFTLSPKTGRRYYAKRNELGRFSR